MGTEGLEGGRAGDWSRPVLKQENQRIVDAWHCSLEEGMYIVKMIYCMSRK